jgi:hypothetical protein
VGTPLHPLAGVVEKLRNADEHLLRFQAEALAYLNGGPNASILTERDTDDSGRGRLRLKVHREPPLKLAAIAGDVVHNLRSSLDYIVVELVKANGHAPTFQHQFPISATPGGFADALKKGRLYGVHERAVRAIDQFQSYHVKPQFRAKYPLLHLHKLSNRDKHHMLALSALNGGFAWTFVGAGGRVVRDEQSTEAIFDGGILADIPTDFVIDGEKTQLQAKLTVAIGFNEPDFIGFDVAAVLQRIRELVGEFMLPAFGSFFDPLPDDLKLASHGLTDPPRSVDLAVLVRPNPEQNEI